MRLLDKSFRWISLTALLAFTSGCGGSGSDSESDSGSDSDTTGGSGTSAGAPGSTSTAECDGAFARVPSPYSPNTSIEDWGGFLADEQGLVFSAIPDPSQDDYDADLPTVIMSSDLSGSVETLFTPSDPVMIGSIFAFGEDLYFASGLLSQEILRMPRAGGEATPVSEDRIWAGPRSDGEKLYYSTRPELDSFVVVSFDPATDEATTLAERGAAEVAALTVEGDTLYWIEVPDQAGDFSLYRLPVAGGDPELVMDLPNSMALGDLRVIDEVVFADTLTGDFDIQIHRAEFGQAPEVVEDLGGMPMLIVNDTVYYNSSSGLATNSLEFDAAGVVAGTQGMPIAALAASASHVYYASGPCIYRTAL